MTPAEVVFAVEEDGVASLGVVDADAGGGGEAVVDVQVDGHVAGADAVVELLGVVGDLADLVAGQPGGGVVPPGPLRYAKALEARRVEACNGFLELVDRAKATGRLREDFADRDMPVLLMANASVLNSDVDAAPDARSHPCLMVRACRHLPDDGARHPQRG
ncbi:hypothetical protein [Streptomyces roseolus]|uniref:hypothetical protein n=1 Tax=Streptomyces roseolus TaxID=67358 RepID=UPI003668B34D